MKDIFDDHLFYMIISVKKWFYHHCMCATVLQYIYAMLS